MAGARNPVLPNQSKGNRDEVLTADVDGRDLLEEILTELKISNKHNEEITEETITSNDVGRS